MRVLHDPTLNFPVIPGLKNLPEIPALRKIPRLKVLLTRIGRKLNNWKPTLLLLSLMAIWFIPPAWLHRIDPTVATIDQSIWLMVILSLITFLLIIALCWWLLNLHWRLLGLPPISLMVSHFNLFTLCQQLVFYFISFALLLLAALGCLIAIF
jgi:hypothetical protein